jgi:nucleoside-diphosphate-sugar epimerase
MAWGHVFFLYGPGEPTGRLVPSVVRSILGGEEARCTVGTHVRDFLHAADVASAFTAILRSEVEGGINIGSGHPTTIAEVARRAAALAGRPNLLRLGAIPMSHDDPSVMLPATRRLFSEVGWSRQFTDYATSSTGGAASSCLAPQCSEVSLPQGQVIR